MSRPAERSLRDRCRPWGVLLLCGIASISRAADPAGLLDRWFAAQASVQTWSADLIQTRSLKVLAQPLVSTGKVWVAMPDRFRWELGQPAQTIALRQSNQLCLIYPRLKRVEKYALDGGQGGPWQDALALLEASFPRNRTDLESRFRLRSVTQTNGTVQVALQPKSESARRFMAEIQVTFRTQDFSPAATEVSFSDGSRLRSEFRNAVLNAPLGGAWFEAKVEADFQVVEPLRR